MGNVSAIREWPQEVQPPAFAAAHLAALIESTQDLIWSVDLKYRLVTFNKALSGAFARGYGAKVTAGMTPRALLPSGKGAVFPPLYEKALREGPCSAEYRLKDGRYLEMTFNPIIQDGRKVGVSVIGKDVTEQKSARKTLLRVTQQYREFFEFAPEAIFRTTAEGKTVALNPAGATLLGYGSPGEAIAVLNDWGREVWFDPQERAAFIAAVEQQGEARSGPCQFRRKDETLFWGILSGRKICGPDGKTLYYQGFMEDITERKAAVDAIQKAEEQYREFFESAPEGIFQIEPGGRLLAVNAAGLKIFGFESREEALRITRGSTGEYWADQHDRAACVEALEKHGAIDRYECWMKRHDGTLVWVGFSVRRICGPDGKTLYYQGFMVDLTERKTAEEALSKAEQRFREIFEDAPEGIFQTSKEGRSLALNPAGARMLGFASPKDAVASISDSAHDVWLNPLERARYTQLLKEKREIRDFSCQFKRTDGTPIWVSLSARKVCGPDGQTLYYQGFMEDMTEQKALELDLKVKVRELQVLSEMNNALLHAKTEEELLTEYCRIVVEVAGYRMAWVGFAEEGPEKRVLPVAHYGHEDGYLKIVNLDLGGHGARPGAGRALHSDRGNCCGERLRSGSDDRSLARRGGQAGLYVMHRDSFSPFR